MDFPEGTPDFIFLSVNGGQLTTGALCSIVKRVAAHSSVKGKFSGHSLRIGGATAAMMGGFTLEQIRAIGGWESDAVFRYIRAAGPAQLGASEVMGF